MYVSVSAHVLMFKYGFMYLSVYAHESACKYRYEQITVQYLGVCRLCVSMYACVFICMHRFCVSMKMIACL